MLICSKLSNYFIVNYLPPPRVKDAIVSVIYAYYDVKCESRIANDAIKINHCCAVLLVDDLVYFVYSRGDLAFLDPKARKAKQALLRHMDLLWA